MNQNEEVSQIVSPEQKRWNEKLGEIQNFLKKSKIDSKKSSPNLSDSQGIPSIPGSLPASSDSIINPGDYPSISPKKRENRVHFDAFSSEDEVYYDALDFLSDENVVKEDDSFNSDDIDQLYNEDLLQKRLEKYEKWEIEEEVMSVDGDSSRVLTPVDTLHSSPVETSEKSVESWYRDRERMEEEEEAEFNDLMKEDSMEAEDLSNLESFTPFMEEETMDSPSIETVETFEEEVQRKYEVKVNKLTLEIGSDGKEKRSVKEDVQMGCRAFRAVGNDMKRFLMVQFPRESSWNKKRRKELIRKCMNEGVEFDGKKYSYLGFTENDISLMKQVYFLEKEDFTCESLLKYFGDLDEVWRKDGVKYFSRFGMCFSASIPVMKIPKDKVMRIADRVIPKKKCDGIINVGEWNFTDGCGIITPSVAETIREKLDLKRPPSVVQFRWGGAKGVLVVHPPETIQKILKSMGRGGEYRNDTMMYLRDSNYKFNSSLEDLEILGYSRVKNRDAALNDNIVLILNDLGVPYMNIRQLFSWQLDKIMSMSKDHKSIKKFIHYFSRTFDSTLSNKLWEMILCNVPLDDPHVKNIITAFQKTELTTLENKLRVEVPNSHLIYGVADDTQTLKPGEVYATFGEGPLFGDVVVFRHPSYHPGDVQKLKAVCPPELLHLTQPCIVFPTVGDRPIPDTMGGGDLDGDLFFVSNCSLIIPPNNEAPADYSAARGISHYKQMGMKEAALEFFCEFPEKNMTGKFANVWNRVAQLYDCRHPLVRKIASSFGRSIDSSKSGIMEEWDPIYDKFINLPKYIGGLMWRTNPNYQATRKFPPLKGLKVMIEDLMHEIMDGQKNAMLIEPSPCFAYKKDTEQWTEFYNEARQHFESFNRKMGDAIHLQTAQYTSIKPKKRKFGFFAVPVTEISLKKTEELERWYRKEHFDGLCDEDRKIKASAWYYFSYNHKKTSFGWIGYTYLNHILADESWRNKFGRDAPRIALSSELL
eukprot:TRINITY_DN6333_c0_g3_i1.p1 TRINITY_DN6333_c0_g3~~TRINITY_DN6333_c0_g3_i1.p1  ORF type:complete len:985 (-),score=283.69 TRINITY_DN6333_c0_g3_i1:968-3922(-)